MGKRIAEMSMLPCIFRFKMYEISQQNNLFTPSNSSSTFSIVRMAEFDTYK
jgi:hypothetical protein